MEAKTHRHQRHVFRVRAVNRDAPLSSLNLVRILVEVMVRQETLSRDLAHNNNKIDNNSNLRGKLLRNNNRGPNPPSRNNNAHPPKE